MQLARTGLDAGPHRHAAAVENALRVLLAIGGSTNAVIHLTAIAGRPASTSTSAVQRDQRRDAGPGRPEADRHALHGGPVRRRRHRRGAARVAPLLHLDCLTVTGETLGERLAAPAGPVDRAVVSRSPTRWSRRRARRAVRLARARRARSSSARPPTPSCSSRRAAPSCSPRSRISRRASTIPTST